MKKLELTKNIFLIIGIILSVSGIFSYFIATKLIYKNIKEVCINKILII